VADATGLERSLLAQLAPAGVLSDGTPVFGGQAPPGSTGAAIVLSDWTTERGQRTHEGVTDGGTITTLSADCYGATRDGAREAARTLRQALTAIRGVIGSGADACKVWWIEETTSRDLTNQRIGDQVDHRVSVEFEIAWNEED
jgi:hypothetical protein